MKNIIPFFIGIITECIHDTAIIHDSNECLLCTLNFRNVLCKSTKTKTRNSGMHYSNSDYVNGVNVNGKFLVARSVNSLPSTQLQHYQSQQHYNNPHCLLLLHHQVSRSITFLVFILKYDTIVHRYSYQYWECVWANLVNRTQ